VLDAESNIDVIVTAGQAPIMAVEQFAFVPPLDPEHVQTQGPIPDPDTAEAVPTEQRFVVGLLASV
jgi:hypothetical protein